MCRDVWRDGEVDARVDNGVLGHYTGWFCWLDGGGGSGGVTKLGDVRSGWPGD